MKIAYLGPSGTFSEEVAVRFFTNKTSKFCQYQTISDVLDAVLEKQVDKGVVPIENAIEGTITVTADSLSTANLWIEDEVILPIQMSLLVNSHTLAKDIKEVWSIYPALAQCHKFIRANHFKVKQFESTAAAAKALKESGKNDVAAIASLWAAKVFDLQIATNSIQDNPENHTRFIVVSRQKENEKVFQKTMLVLTPKYERPGILAAILNVFNALSINLTWIESRPTKMRLGTYRFFIEASGAVNEEKIKKAIIILKALDHKVKVLGSYSTTLLSKTTSK